MGESASSADQPGVAPKRIVVFSDGTGNSSAKLFKTNVWRLYQAVDTTPSAGGAQRQIVVYDDGVGTSSFKPLAVVGGAFGVGLMRNVLDLYRFICRNYNEGDEIYAFGFSRGAFTIRVLVGLLTSVGVIRDRKLDHGAMELLSRDAYRVFRRHFRLAGNPWLSRAIVTRLRNFRDRRIERSRKRSNQPTLTREDLLEIPSIAFVGVWDTVAAYGFPIAEITKGIDRWVWPLSMPDYKLSKKVRCARHALALDDERDTFHPLLWDEVNERNLAQSGDVSPDRVRQVWFAGMHSDVGGGYSDESLAHVSLVWMAKEAMKAGLRLRSGALAEFEAKADALGPLHDSRSGLAAYYRYQPRKISARLMSPDPTTQIFQDPDLKGRGMLTGVLVHDSVLERIALGTDGYAPIVLPGDYTVEGGPQREAHPGLRATAQERVWDRVWRRRVNYFTTLWLTLCLAVLGLVPPPATSCIGPQCVLSPALRAVSAWLPSFLARWIEAYANRPGLFFLLAVAVVLLLRQTAATEVSLRDRMRRLFSLSLSQGSSATADLSAEAAVVGRVRRLRRSHAYQASLQFLKWRASPAVAAALIYAVGVPLAASVVFAFPMAIHRAHLVWSERAGMFCRAPAAASASSTFSTSDMCWRVPESAVVAGERYRLHLTVLEPWKDGELITSPEGFSSDRLSWWLRTPAALLRRSMHDPWFRPLIYVAGDGTSRPRAFLSVPMRLVEFSTSEYVGEFTAPATGKESMLSINDAVFLWGRHPEYFYSRGRGQNQGSATAWIESCDAVAKTAPCRF